MKVINGSHLITADQVKSQNPSTNIKAVDGYEFAGWENTDGDIENKLENLDAKNGQLILYGNWYPIQNVTFGFALEYLNNDNQLENYSFDNCSVRYGDGSFTNTIIRKDLITNEGIAQAIADFRGWLVFNEGYDEDHIIGWKIALQNEYPDWEHYHLEEFTIDNINAIVESMGHQDVCLTIIPVFDI